MSRPASPRPPEEHSKIVDRMVRQLEAEEDGRKNKALLQHLTAVKTILDKRIAK